MEADKAFSLAKSIQKKYESSLDFRDATFEAYGNLPADLDNFAAKYSKGGPLSDFYTLSQTISTEASNGYETLNAYNIEADDKALYDLRLAYLLDNRDVFANITKYFKAGNIKSGTDEIAAFSVRNVKANEAIKSGIEAYVKTSSIATDFEAYNTL